MAKRIVLSIGAATASDDEHFSALSPDAWAAVKKTLDDLHMDKIALADEILVLNVNDYIGESTTRELNWARHLGKRVRWWEWPSAHAIADEIFGRDKKEG